MDRSDPDQKCPMNTSDLGPKCPDTSGPHFWVRSVLSPKFPVPAGPLKRHKVVYCPAEILYIITEENHVPLPGPWLKPSHDKARI